MKIHLIHHFMRTGGVERQLYYLANGLTAGNQVTVMLCEKEGSLLDFLDDRVSIVDLQIPYRNRLQFGLLWRVVAILKRDRPDVLISFHGSFHWISVIAGKLVGVRVVCVFHGYLDRGLLSGAHRLFLGRAHGLVAVSHSVRNSLVNNLKIAADKVTVVENGIDSGSILGMAAEPLTSQESLFFKETPVIVSLGRLAKGKGFDTVLQALSGLQKKFTLLIIGDGPQNEYLQEQIIKLGLSGKAYLLGNQINPYKFMARASFFVLASETEGLPTVILEAMCLRLPCICARYRGGTKGIIEDRKTGYLVNPNDAYDLRSAIQLFLSSESLPMQNAIATAGKAQVALKFSVQRYITEYDSYLSTLSSGNQ